MDHLKSLDENQDEAIHEARRRFKKVRSIVRLVRGEIGGKAYKKENTCYRDAGRRLSSFRDASVVNQTLDQLVRRYSGQLKSADCAEFRRLLKASNPPRLLIEEKVVVRVADSIEASRRRVAKWPITRNNFSVLRDGLEEAYRHGRRRLAVAYAHRTAESFHEWRKQVAYLRDMVRILEPVEPNELRKLAAGLKRLETHLGEHHDLTVLRQWFLAVVKQSKGADKAGPFLALIDKRQKELESKARPLGERIYKEKPKVFVDRLKEYWRA